MNNTRQDVIRAVRREMAQIGEQINQDSFRTGGVNHESLMARAEQLKRQLEALERGG